MKRVAKPLSEKKTPKKASAKANGKVAKESPKKASTAKSPTKKQQSDKLEKEKKKAVPNGRKGKNSKVDASEGEEENGAVSRAMEVENPVPKPRKNAAATKKKVAEVSSASPVAKKRASPAKKGGASPKKNEKVSPKKATAPSPKTKKPSPKKVAEVTTEAPKKRGVTLSLIVVLFLALAFFFFCILKFAHRVGRTVRAKEDSAEQPKGKKRKS
jgi:hypothetical protein